MLASPGFGADCSLFDSGAVCSLFGSFPAFLQDSAPPRSPPSIPPGVRFVLFLPCPPLGSGATSSQSTFVSYSIFASGGGGLSSSKVLLLSHSLFCLFTFSISWPNHPLLPNTSTPPCVAPIVCVPPLQRPAHSEMAPQRPAPQRFCLPPSPWGV